MDGSELIFHEIIDGGDQDSSSEEKFSAHGSLDLRLMSWKNKHVMGNE